MNSGGAVLHACWQPSLPRTGETKQKMNAFWCNVLTVPMKKCSEKQLAEAQAKLRISQQRSDDLLQVVQRISNSPSMIAKPSTSEQEFPSSIESPTNRNAEDDLNTET